MKFYGYSDYRQNFRELWLYLDAFERQRISARACDKRLRGTLDGEASSRLYAARYRAKKKGRKCPLTFDDVRQKILATGGICPVLLRPFERGGGSMCMSLDRLKNGNYTSDEVRIICNRINSAKGARTSVSQLRQVKKSRLDYVDRELLIDYVAKIKGAPGP